MNLPNVLIVAALASSLLLVFQLKQRLIPIVAAVASGLEAVLAFHILKFSLKGINLGLVLGGVLAVAGALIWATKATGKPHVTAATIIALVGAIQVFTALF
jgi:hypothetical protein